MQISLDLRNIMHKKNVIRTKSYAEILHNYFAISITTIKNSMIIHIDIARRSIKMEHQVICLLFR